LICSLSHFGILLRAAEGRRTPGRWRVCWGSSMMTVAVWRERSVLPHPYPLPLGEGAVHGKVGTFEIFSCQRRSHFTGDSRAILPLPAGVGKDEGEASILNNGYGFVETTRMALRVAKRSGVRQPSGVL